MLCLNDVLRGLLEESFWNEYLTRATTALVPPMAPYGLQCLVQPSWPGTQGSTQSGSFWHFSLILSIYCGINIMLLATQICFNSPHRACCFWLDPLLMESSLPGKPFILYLPGFLLLILKDFILVKLSLASSSPPNYSRCLSPKYPTLYYNGVLISQD